MILQCNAPLTGEAEVTSTFTASTLEVADKLNGPPKHRLKPTTIDPIFILVIASISITERWTPERQILFRAQYIFVLHGVKFIVGKPEDSFPCVPQQFVTCNYTGWIRNWCFQVEPSQAYACVVPGNVVVGPGDHDLLVSQGDHGVDANGLAGWDVAGG